MRFFRYCTGLLADFLCDARKYFWVVRCEFRQNLTVKLDTVLFELGDERAVGLESILADGGVEAHYPEGTEIILFVATMGERVPSGTHDCLVSIALFLRT